MEEQPKILIVDDSQELSDVISEFMEAHGFTVHTTANSYSAIKMADAGGYSVVVSDIHMPEMDGLELMARLKTMNPSIPVVLITGYSVIEARKIALEKGADAFVAKPFHMKELLDVIASLLNNNKSKL
jgi:CheY-like chemotaxis protein